MNAEQMDSGKDIILNLQAIRGTDFARIVLRAAQASAMCGAVLHCDLSDPQQVAAMQQAVFETVSKLLAEITLAHDFDPQEITEWADRLNGCLQPTQH